MALIDRFSGDVDDRRMSLGEHLEELRKHVWKSMIWIALALTGCLCFQEPLMKWATYPHTSCMKQLEQEREFEESQKKIGKSAFMVKAIEELYAQAPLLKESRELERKATEIRHKIAENPEKLVDALAQRRTDLLARIAKIRVQQETLLVSPDLQHSASVEEERLALAKDLKVYTEDVARELVPLSEKGDVFIPQQRLVALKYTEGFMSYLKVAMVCAIFVASPLVARELWKFVSAGLYKHEKKYVTFFAPVTFIVFIIGCAFGYYALIPAGLKFLANYGGDEIATDIQLSEYLSLFLNLTLMVGLIFELPLVMGFISLIGFITPDGYKKFRRYWLLVAFILGAVIAPSPDPFNQSMCAVPLIILYEIGILLSRWIVRNRERELMNPLPEGVQMAPMPSTPMPQPGAPTPK